MNAGPRMALLALIGVAAGAVNAIAASVQSTASGTVWGSHANDQDTGPGLAPVASAADYVRPVEPVDGEIHAAASAAVGRLGARASSMVLNAPGYLSGSYVYYGTTDAQGFATFADRWTFGGQPLDTPGLLRVTLAFDGTSSGSATGGTPSTFGQFTFSITSLEEFDNVHDSDGYISGQLPIANELVMIELDFLYGRPINVMGTLVARAGIFSSYESYSYSGSAEAVFDQTAELADLEVQNGQGGWTHGYSLQTESGGTYPFQAPEPGRLGAAGTSLAALAWLLRRRDRRNAGAARTAP